MRTRHARPVARRPRAARRKPAGDTEGIRDRVPRRLGAHGHLGLVSEVALAHAIPIKAIVAPERDELARAARSAAWKRLYFERFLSTPEIARLFEVADDTVGRAVLRG